MLKALELYGFKSFADKTRFEFPPGITVVVGPNGSGKSNIVDAIKWVLGEQSAKSLRGKDMADVIFKGSGGTAGGRKALNTAEATIVIDNADGQLPVDAPEVHVTRRVYRSGEGEYLINRQACRLKDIKDLFRGTGVGTDAYSLIEQGKVDQLLQASSKDRRAIFEEAAGISRFKAKKVEAQRRLERVDQNLLRLSDIVAEVESRLRSVRAQASKARRYKEYSDRLQQLRTQVGLVDWRNLSEQLDDVQRQITGLRNQAEEEAARIEALESRSLELELESNETADAIRSAESRISKHREQIAAHDGTIAHQRARCRDMEDEQRRYRGQVLALSSRAGDLQQRLRETEAELKVAEADHDEIQQRAHLQESTLAELTQQTERLRTEHEGRRKQYVEDMRRAATLGNQVSSLQSQLDSAAQFAERCAERLHALDEQSRAEREHLERLQQQRQDLAETVAQSEAEFAAAKLALDQSRKELARQQEELAQWQAKLSGASQRAQVLEDLEKKFEGIGTGVQEVLTQARGDKSGPFGQVLGLVADFLHADIETAALIDVALGEAAHHVVMSGSRLLEFLESGEVHVSGRVGFVRLDALPAGRDRADVDLSGRPGVIERADRLVKTAPNYQSFVDHLLGDTWIVETLTDAVGLSRVDGRGQRFVTRSGQLLERDGTLVIGTMHQAAGIVSRRTQLRTLEEQVHDLEKLIATAKQTIRTQQAQLETNEAQASDLDEKHHRAVTSLREVDVRIQTVQERNDVLQKEHRTVEAELKGAETQQASFSVELEQAQSRRAKLEAELADMESALSDGDARLEALESRRQQCSQQLTAHRIELAKSDQRLESLRLQMSRFELDQQERTRTIAEIKGQLQHCNQRQVAAERAVLEATSALSGLYLDVERLAGETAALHGRRETLMAERNSLSGEIQRHRKSLRTSEEKQHEAELAAGELNHQRNSLAERLREDYGIELAQLTHEPTDEEEHEREAVEEEIATLRRKINNIGAVNMEALAELEELEVRFGSLSNQHQDLMQAKDALERIIQKINADSRRLFSETLEAIRTNFQALYRKAFGGGRADLVLEEGVDMLEAGIDIIATPPGKPQFNNSLLSGGEKALTAVALLLAIFQYRPSPFCVLDEVDAPFDEANIGRFIDVLNDFLGWTKFVIVTHSKKTMTAATTLYGVTMQESGVSKQVSVRFEDVSEDGHIAQSALDRQESEDANAA